MKPQIIHIRNPLHRKHEDWRLTADQWLITHKGENFDYFTGVGHRVHRGLQRRSRSHYTYGWYKQNLHRLTPDGFQEFLNLTRPLPPEWGEFVRCVVSDSDACDQSFEDWCFNVGYDTDSRKALETYLACQDNYNRLCKVTTQEERDSYDEY